MYIKPTIQVIQVENEGIMALSTIPGPGIDTRSTSGSAGSSANTQQNTNSFQELEELINDLLTY